MFAGGIADKGGNRYELRWTVRQLLDVIGAQAQSLRYESPDPSAGGFEFSVVRDGRTEWHQTKINSAHGNWTLSALHREGVLEAFKKRLAINDTDICVFVSQDPARDLRDISEEARITGDLKEYESVLADEKLRRFRELQEKWAVDANVAFAWLRRCEFRAESEQSIEGTSSHLSAIYFSNTSNEVFSILSGFLLGRLNIEITTEYVRNQLLADRALSLKDWKIDPTLRERLEAETRAYLETYTPFGIGGSVIQRSEAQALFDAAADPDGPKVILVTGGAGSGKSGVIREFSSRLATLGIPHLALRIDQHLNCASPSALGKDILGRDESPAVTLKGLFPDRRSILIVDQLDAVSEVSGRNGAVRDGVLRLVDEVRNFRTLVLVLVCRTFDLETDQRLKALRSTKDIAQIDIQALSWEQHIKPRLEAKGVSTDQITESQKALLQLPLNLSIFVEVLSEGVLGFKSRSDLFRSLLDRKSRSIRGSKNVSWELIAPLYDLAAWMSDAQRLNAPEDVLIQYAGAVDVLSSESLLIRSRGHINFFHESFFDYIFARGFARRAQSIVSLLTSAEQHLFRRTQVRQILETLRQSDESRYLVELRAVLHEHAIRYHIKVAVAQWLGAQSDPSNSEMDIVFGLDDSNEQFPALVRYAALSSAGWFDLLHANGRISEVLRAQRPDREQAMLWWLSVIASERPIEVANLLNDWWAGDADKGKRLIDWFSFFTARKSDGALTDLFCRVVRSKPPGLFTGRDNTNQRLLFHGWTGDGTSGAANVLSAYFDTWFEAHPGKHPFEETLTDLDAHALGEFAKRSPDAFVDGTFKAFTRTIALIQQEESVGKRDFTFMMREFSGHHFRSDAFLNIFRSCLKQIACEKPGKAREVLRAIVPSAHQACTHLWLETISANAQALADLLVPLIASPHLFDAGWHGCDWKSFADAAREAIPYLAAAEIEKIEIRILSYSPEIDFAKKIARDVMSAKPGTWFTKQTVIHYLNDSGFEEWCILETIGLAHLNSSAQARLRQLRRKFPNRIIPAPHHNEASWVGPPIARDRTSRMDDRHWLRAIERYNDEHERSRSSFLVSGGARELARELQELTKSQPARFANLLLEIPLNSHSTYAGHILFGLAEVRDLDDVLLERAVRRAHAWPGRPFGSEIGGLFKSHPHLGMNADLFDILAWYVDYGEANSDEAIDASNMEREIASIDDLLNAGQGLHVRGINGARGWACEALGAVIWNSADVAGRAWNIVERRASVEQLVSVRCCLINPALALFNHDQNRCAALVDCLSTPPDALKGSNAQQTKWWAPLITYHGVRLHQHIMFSVPNVGRRLIARLLRSGDDSARAIGVWHVFQMSFRDQRYVWLANAFSKRNSVYRRLLADVASYAIVQDEYRDRAEEVLRAGFNDPDKLVRNQAADVFRNIGPTDFAGFKALASDFVSSRAFDGDPWAFFHSIEEAKCNVIDLTIAAAEKVISDIRANGSRGGRRVTDLHQIQGLIRKEYVDSEGNPDLRRRLLDIIDGMLSMELHGVEAIVSAHER